jgi:hypothetical protein
MRFVCPYRSRPIFNVGLKHMKLQYITDSYTKLGIFDTLSFCERKRRFVYTFFFMNIYTLLRRSTQPHDPPPPTKN